MTSYRVEFTDVAQAEADAAYLRRSQRTSPEEASECYAGIFTAAQTLVTMPRRWQPVPHSDQYEGDVRRMLYGRGSTAHHIIYRIIDPAVGEAEGIVRVLHVYHGARRTSQNSGDPNDGAEEQSL